MQTLNFESTGMFVPPKVVTNDDLAKIVDTSDEWIFQRTGIHSRHIASNMSNAQMAAKACEQALQNANANLNDLYCIIMATFSPDTFSPANACEVHRLLQLPEHVIAFDINAACPGFLVSLHVARGLLMQSTYGSKQSGSAKCGGTESCAQGGSKKALVVASERASEYTDWTDRSTCVLFGDGAGAAVVSLKEGGDIFFTGGTREGIDAISVSANPESGDDFKVIRMKGKEVFRFAVQAIYDTIEDLLAQSGDKLEDVDHFVFHQANARIINHVVEKMHIDKSKIYMNIDRYGNTSAASSAICLAEMNAKGMIARGEKVMMICFGAGLVYEGILLEW